MAECFDHEKLDVYKLSVDFVSWIAGLLDEMEEDRRPHVREIRSQVNRASLSCLLNIAEGNGRRSHKGRAKFFDDSRGSCTECAACLDALVATCSCKTDRIEEGKAMLLRIVSMLTKLIERFDKK